MTEACALCGGAKQAGATTFTVDYSYGILVVRNVPALMCCQCGEEWIEDEVAERLEQMSDEARHEKKQVEVLDFSQTVPA